MSLTEFNYQKQFQSKKLVLKSILAPFTHCNILAFDSPRQNFRMRAEFRIWHQGNRASYAMFLNSDKKSPALIDTFPHASKKINTLMPQLKSIWDTNPILKEKLFQVDFLTTLSKDSMVTFCYHKTLEEKWLETAQKISLLLNTKIIGRAKKQKLMTDVDHVLESLTILGNQYFYFQPENSFTQPNAVVNQKMISWVCQNLKNFTGDLLELYCGNGNFTIPMSKVVNNIFSTEINKLSISALEKNIQINQIKNVKFARLSAEELTQAINKTRTFKRLINIDLEHYQFETVFVDPPRAGLDAETCRLISQFTNIIYISCNPYSLATNLNELIKSHEITAVALFDQFPYTPHIETGLILKKRI